MKRLLALRHQSQERVFQRVLCGVRSSNGPWFCNAPLGHNSLSQMMSLLSVAAKLSTRYTNHCIRASVVTELEDSGFSSHEVCTITGHQNEGSLQRYDRIDPRGSECTVKVADVLDRKEGMPGRDTSVNYPQSCFHACILPAILGHWRHSFGW